jgi:hypothetical protein
MSILPASVQNLFHENYVPLKEIGRPKGYGIQFSLAFEFSGSWVALKTDVWKACI